MQSRHATTASSRLYRALFVGRNEQVLPHRFTVAASTSNRSKTADPAIHYGELEAGPEVHLCEPQVSLFLSLDSLNSHLWDANKTKGRICEGNLNEPVIGTNADKQSDTSFNRISDLCTFFLQGTEKSGAVKADHWERGTGTDPLVQPKAPLTSSPRLESTEVNHPSGHNLQQKRTAGSSVAPLEEVSCVGLDGSPWPKDKKEEQKSEREQTLDDREYYKHHKASPLSEIEVADTRKAITQATDGTAADPSVYGGGRDVMEWRPEQLDTAEEALKRAALIWKQNAMRGDPDSPHGSVLRELRGEWF
ncbi:hypothetical protein SLEP1_g1391 [Rubroshorea leprosula]|uniref:Uncharacterized protein n=1 Tax=Rubroshorea leprosula TaxID=152421 RepID=A0AAV5HDN8_9ROSI|nr:hypothetical protein SLEP1_g1391 [Rubroshorea leprosula]